ncbi:MAG: TrkH family potassium uptake protein [Phycisphaerae bacterium]
MNFGLVIRQLGLLLMVMSACVLSVAVWSCVQVLSGEADERMPLQALVLAVLIGGFVGGLMRYGAGRGAEPIRRREAILLVALSWFVGAGLAALPFRIWGALAAEAAGHPFAGFVDCYFEAMSGLTTTGATVLTDISALPRSLLLWRAVTHWLGGLGIVLLFVAVLPMLGVGGKRLFRVEAAGPTPEGVAPRIQEAVRALWYIYLGMTVAEILALKLVGMSWFDAVCHTFATLATGGFSSHNASVAGYNSVGVELVILLFMVAAGINFGLYYQLLRRRWRPVLEDQELRCYLALLAIGSIVVVWSIHGMRYDITTGQEAAGDIASSVRYGVFQVVAVQTTTGFCTADFDQWGFVAKAAMLALMFVGGSAGSTGGGLKVIRCLMAVKIMWAEIEHVFRPQVVRVVKIGRATIDNDMKLSTMVYIMGIAVLTVLGVCALMWLERGSSIDVTTAFTASIASLNNIGPGLARVGATCNYGWFTDGSKCVMIVLMALGRLEVFTIVVLVFPRFWRSD